MEPQGDQALASEEGSGSCSRSSFLCRQSSARWIPTSDQVRILKDLYYNGGIRSPNAEQIQKISARLRQYGKIEGKNVFYWFQNHKARERQKKRFTVDIPIQKGGWKAEESVNKFYTPGSTTGFSCTSSSSSSSPGARWGHTFMHSSFREFSICDANGGGFSSSGLGWAGMEPPPAPFLTGDPMTADVETLQLFPMHGGGRAEEDAALHGGWLASGSVSSASLELSLGGAHHSAA